MNINEIWKERTGQDVAVYELALYFNNNTIMYAAEVLKDVPKQDWTRALVEAGFDKDFATLMIRKWFTQVPEDPEEWYAEEVMQDAYVDQTPLENGRD